MPISVESFLRDHPVERVEGDDENNSVKPHTRKKISHKSVLLSAKNNTKNMPYVKNAKVSDLSDELCNSSEDDCREAALKLLDYAPRSVMDMRKRLKEKGYTEVAIDAVIRRLLELHLLDDNQYAQMVIRSCSVRLLGARATRMELQRKNVDPAAISQNVASAQNSGVFTEAAWELGRKTASRTRNLEPLVRRRRFFAAAARKGHDLNVINEVYAALFESNNE
ncbi:regulatory protein RecX [Gardnerella vaginalis]|uniref:regulatory protein RecX n=1 Tax=Gardnerella vaginalis TaxID=2702 RepID=UPI0039F040A2